MGKKTELVVEWDPNEKERLKELIKGIKKRSEFLAEEIKNRIKRDLTLVRQNPFIFESDPLKENNDGSFRKFTALQIRIVYKIDPEKIIIVRVRHAASEPIDYL